MRRVIRRLRSRLHSIHALALAAALAGCGDRPAEPPRTPVASPSPPPASASTDSWLGRWTGTEGTFLELGGGQGSYEVTIRNLDGPRKFAAKADGAVVAFERDGTREILRATDGAGTGMKWLAGKKDCLALRSGEGWCRD
jgi:glucose/arabinose dehydrogenase